MTNEEIQKLKDAGIDDATIQSIAAEDAAKQVPSAMQTQGPVAPEALPEVDVTKPSETLRNAQAAGVPTTNEGSYLADAAAIGAAAAPYVVPTVLTGAGLYGAAKVGGWGRNLVNTLGQGINAMNAQSMAAQHAAEGIADRAAVQQGVMTAQEMAQRQAAREAAAAAARGPVVPQGTSMSQAPKPRPNIIQQGMDMAGKVRQAAAQRITNLPAAGEALSGAARFAGRVLGPASLALQTTDLGPKTPQVGRMRGMEINPLTGAPWTPDQIKQYEANSMMFDQQLAQPQMRR
jgi:hypothetical protein